MCKSVLDLIVAELSRSCAFVRGASSAVVALGLIISISLIWPAPLSAETFDQRLANAERAYRQDDFKSASDELRHVKDSVEKLPLREQVAYWDLLANVDDASGRFNDAEKAAARHLTLVRQSSAISAASDSNFEWQLLMRLAKIKRELPSLEGASQVYREALKTSRTRPPTDPLWEAKTRLELASTLELLSHNDESIREFEAASHAADTAIAKHGAVTAASDDFLAAVILIRRAFSAEDKPGAQRQAAKSLEHINRALKTEHITPQLRGKLLIAAAGCYQQMGDSQPAEDAHLANLEAEQHVLERVLSEIKVQRSLLEPIARAEATIRLAELADVMNSMTTNAADSQSTALYRQAAALYLDIQSEARQRRVANERGANAGVAISGEDHSVPSIGDEVECLMRLQLIYTRLADWDAAIQKTEELSKLRAMSLDSDDPNYFRTLSMLGSLYTKKVRASRTPTVGEVQSGSNPRKDIDTARSYLARAAEFWRGHEPHSPADLASTLSNYAEICRDSNDYQQADDLLSEANAYYEHLDNRNAAAQRQLAEFYLNRGAIQAATGYFELAHLNYEKAAKFAADNAGADNRERRRLLALIYINQAQLEKSQRHIPPARADCEQALQVAAHAGFTEVELVPFKLANASLLVAEGEILYSQANVRTPDKRNGDKIDADVSAKFSAAAKQAADILPPAASEPYLSAARHLQALARYRTFQFCGGDPHELQVSEGLWNQIAESSVETAPQMGVLQVRALNYLVEISLRKAKELREQASELSKLEAADETQIASLTMQSAQQLQLAKDSSERAQKLADTTIAYPAIRVQALLARANVLRAESQILRAKAERLPGEQAHQELQLAGNVKSEAVQTLKKAIKVVEMPRAMTVGADEERAAYFAQFRPVFDLLVDLLVEDGRYIEALEIAELRRSRTYQDQLQTSGVDLYATADAAKVKVAKQARDRYYAKLAELNDSWSDKALRAKIAPQMEPLRQAFLEADKDAKSTSHAARQLIVSETFSSDDSADPAKWIHQQIGDEDVALLYYVGAEKSYVFACNKTLGIVAQLLTVSAEQAKSRSLRIPSEKKGERGERRPLRAVDAEQLVREVREELRQAAKGQGRGGGNTEPGGGGPVLVRSGKVDANSDSVVTDILLPADLRQQISKCGARHLIVVPDGALHQLPLELLPCDAERHQYLLDILPPMCYAPSLHIYQDLQQAPASVATPLTLMTVANPRYGAVGASNDPLVNDSLSSTGKEYLNRARDLAPLNGTADESKEVRVAFDSLGPATARVIPLLDANASEAKLKQGLKDSTISFLHIAAHGLTSEEHNNLFG
ncbi:MAG TPA: CHAT domain-containing protein, partial [Lacipirellulaceae bacterium]|nr:CHAT domain-containing protein [Lacipirellulaceae bacterium]